MAKFFHTLRHFMSLNNNQFCSNYNLKTNVSSILNSFNCISKERSLYRHLYTSVPRCASSFKHRDRRDLLKSVAKPDDGTEGENVVSLDASIKTREDMFTDEKTPHLLFSGVPFNQVPICSIRVTKNNTIIVLSDYQYKAVVMRSAGAEGFKKCRKGTNVAGQATALYVSSKAVKMGIKDVRLKVQGLGPGRMAAIKGIEMGGLNIISITDDTRVSFKPDARPRKVRRV